MKRELLIHPLSLRLKELIMWILVCVSPLRRLWKNKLPWQPWYFFFWVKALNNSMGNLFYFLAKSIFFANIIVVGSYCIFFLMKKHWQNLVFSGVNLSTLNHFTFFFFKIWTWMLYMNSISIVHGSKKWKHSHLG